MDIKDRIRALQLIRPNAVWAMRGEKIEWLDKTQSQPTETEIQEAIINVSYISKRLKEYPPIEEQLDAIWKGEPYTAKMKTKILAIKNKYPKITGE